jgi:hypothetical protein
MDWEVSLSDGQNWTNKQWTATEGRLPFRRLVDYIVKNDLYITSCKIKVGNGFFHLPSFAGSRWESNDIPERFWYTYKERFAGGLGGEVKSMEKWEAISYVMGDNRIFYWNNGTGHFWIQNTKLNEEIKESIVDKAYVGTI